MDSFLFTQLRAIAAIYGMEAEERAAQDAFILSLSCSEPGDTITIRRPTRSNTDVPYAFWLGADA